MKKIKLFLLIILILLVAMYSSVFIFVKVKGKEILVKNFKDNFGVEPEVKKITLKFPFDVEIYGFSCEDVTAEKIKASLGFFNPFSFTAVFSKIRVEGLVLKPKIKEDGCYLSPFLKSNKFIITSAGKFVPDKMEFGLIPAALAGSKDNNQDIRVKINRLYVNDAVMELVDSREGRSSLFVLKGIDVDLRDFVYPDFSRFQVSVKTDALEAKDIKMQDFLGIKGWIDYPKRDMDIELNINNINYLAFRDYYPENWKPEKLGVISALLAWTARLNSLNNELTVESTISLEQIEYMKEEELENPNRMQFLKTALAFLKGESDKPTFPIRLKTKMDSPALDFAAVKDDLKDKLKHQIMGSVVKEVINTAGDVLKDGVKGAKDISVDKPIDTLKDIGEQFKDKFKGVFDSFKVDK